MLTTLLLATLLVLAIHYIFSVIAGGVVAIAVFGDVIVCALLIALFVKLIKTIF